MPLDWSFGGVKDTLGGLLAEKGAGLGELTSSPSFNAGMGLLSASRDASVDPFQAALGGLVAGKKGQESDEDRERTEKLRALMAQYFGGQGGGVPGQPAPTPTEQAMQQSLIPGLPGSSAQMPQGGVMPESRVPSYAGLPGGDQMQQQMNRLAWEQIIKGQ